MRVWVSGLLLSLACWAPLASAAELVRLCGAEWPPFTQVKAGRLDQGLSVELIEAAFARMGREVSFTALPWRRCEQAALAGQYHGVVDNTAMPGFITAGRPTSFFIIGMLVRADDPAQRFDWAMVAGQPVGAVLGYNYLPAVHRYDAWRRVDVRGERELLLGLGKKYYRYALCDGLACPSLARELGVPVRFLKPYLGALPMYLVMTPGHEALAARYAEVLEALFAEGVVDSLYRKHLGRGYADVEREAKQAGEGR